VGEPNIGGDNGAVDNTDADRCRDGVGTAGDAASEGVRLMAGAPGLVLGARRMVGVDIDVDFNKI
jgi:hypothetical protein